LVGTVAEPPYLCVWDTGVIDDGEYTVEAVAVPAGNKLLASTASRTIVVANATNPQVTIETPGDDNAIVRSQDNNPVAAEVNAEVSSVEFWLFQGNQAQRPGVDSTSPYGCTLESPVLDGGYELQAVAVASGTVSFSARRPIVLAIELVGYGSIGEALAEPDGTHLILAGMPVIAGTTPPMEDAFYVEDPDRILGLRVATAQSVAAGTLINIEGVLRKPAGEEPRIDAGYVWSAGTASTLPGPLGVPMRALGGSSVCTSLGLPNVGLLVRVCGKVSYVGSDFIYVDDGSAISDGNSLMAPYILAVNGGSMPASITHDNVKGVRVNCVGLDKPGLGDYVVVTGMSSILSLGGNAMPYLRPRTQDDLRCQSSYTDCHIAEPYGHFRAKDSSVIPLGSRVRIVNAFIPNQYGSTGASFKVLDTSRTGIFTFIQANVTVRPYNFVTATGTSVENTYGDQIVADCLYIGGGANTALEPMSPMAYGLSAVGRTSSSVAAGGPISRPGIARGLSPVDVRDGCIGWALAQRDGTVVDLKGEIITGEANGGRSLGLREPYEPSRGIPRLVLGLSSPIARLSMWNQVDVIGGTLATLSNGQRAIMYPRAVYVWTDMKGTPMLFVPKWLGPSGQLEEWPWRMQVYPR
jgi:hypothetical protein